MTTLTLLRFFVVRFLAATILAGIPLSAFAEVWSIEGRVVGVSDGDTITVLDAEKKLHKVRLAGIDAPEKGQAFGNASKENLSRLIFDQRVEARCHKRDRYGREVCVVLIGSRDAGLEQVAAGMAWHYKQFEREQASEERIAYESAEGAARVARSGLWQDKKPVPPWAWRAAAAKDKKI